MVDGASGAMPTRQVMIEGAILMVVESNEATRQAATVMMMYLFLSRGRQAGRQAVDAFVVVVVVVDDVVSMRSLTL